MQPQELHKADSSQETNLLFKSKEQPEENKSKAKDMLAGLEESKDDDDDDELEERAEPEDEDDSSGSQGNNQST